MSLAVFLDVRSGKATDLSKAYANTDQALQPVKWRKYSNERIFENKLRFQIRIDDFRYLLIAEKTNAVIVHKHFTIYSF